MLRHPEGRGAVTERDGLPCAVRRGDLVRERRLGRAPHSGCAARYASILATSAADVSSARSEEGNGAGRTAQSPDGAGPEQRTTRTAQRPQGATAHYPNGAVRVLRSCALRACALRALRRSGQRRMGRRRLAPRPLGAATLGPALFGPCAVRQFALSVIVSVLELENFGVVARTCGCAPYGTADPPPPGSRSTRRTSGCASKRSSARTDRTVPAKAGTAA